MGGTLDNKIHVTFEQQKCMKTPRLGNPTMEVPPLKSTELRERDMGSSIFAEVNHLLKLAVPTVLVYLMTSVVSMSTVLFCERLGEKALMAAYNIDVMFLQVLTFVLMFGLASAVEAVCGQAYGARRFNMLGIYLHKSAILLVMYTVLPLVILHALCEPIMILLHGSEWFFSTQNFQYIYGLIPGLFAYAIFFPVHKFLQAQNTVIPSACAWAGALVLHLVLSWLFILRLGFGVLGASLVLSLSWWVVVVVLVVYITINKNCKDTWNGFSFAALTGKDDFNNLMEWSFLTIVTDFVSFHISFVAVGTFVTNTFDILSICLGMTTWMYMISIGLSAAVSTRVSNALGAGNTKAAKFTVAAATLTCFSVALVLAVIVLVFRERLTFLFVEGSEFSDAMVQLSPYLAAVIVLNSLRPVITGVILGCGWQKDATCKSFFIYCATGIPLGLLLSIFYDYHGCMMGLLVGGVAQTLVMAFTIYNTDWVHEVEETCKRLDAWEMPKK